MLRGGISRTLAAAIALPFLLGALGLLVMWRRRRAVAEEREQLTTRDARDELVVSARRSAPSISTSTCPA